jgi:exodeoxyribonuclease V alpha subunit
MGAHFPMLQRNLLYTALTRGKRLVILIGTQHAIRTAVENDRSGKRLSVLKALLQEKRVHPAESANGSVASSRGV